MKIICMDCQTESYIEVELLKDKKHFKCEHCAENSQAGFTNQMGEQFNFATGDIVDFHSVSAAESPSEKGISLFDEDKVLDIPPLYSPSEPIQSPEIDEIISVPFDDLKSASSEEDASAAFIDDDATEKGEPLVPESPQHISTPFVPVVEASTQMPESSNLHRLAEETFHELPGMPKGVKVATVKTSILMGVAVVFVLFIALGDKIIRPANKAENLQPVITPKQENVKPAPPVISLAQPEPAQPIPTPAVQTVQVVETKPADTKPTPNQSPVAAAAEGQLTVQVGSHNDVGQANEQANKLRVEGFESRVVSVDIPKRGRWYRVQSGSFSNRAEANRHGEQILAKGAAENFVIAQP